jgi:hypothetical protein
MAGLNTIAQGASYTWVILADPDGLPLDASVVYQSGTFAAAAAGTVTLTAVAGKTTYIRGFTVTAAPAAAIVSGLVTVSGLANALGFQFTESATAQSIISQFFGNYGIPASGVNVPIILNLPAITGGAASALVIWGYQI